MWFSQEQNFPLNPPFLWLSNLSQEKMGPILRVNDNFLGWKDSKNIALHFTAKYFLIQFVETSLMYWIFSTKNFGFNYSRLIIRIMLSPTNKQNSSISSSKEATSSKGLQGRLKLTKSGHESSMMVVTESIQLKTSNKNL